MVNRGTPLMWGALVCGAVAVVTAGVALYVALDARHEEQPVPPCSHEGHDTTAPIDDDMITGLPGS